MDHSDLDRLFTYHAPKADQPKRYVAIRAAAKAFATTICDNCPSSPERTLALRDIQRAVMMANASIAVNETGLDETAAADPDRPYEPQREETGA